MLSHHPGNAQGFYESSLSVAGGFQRVRLIANDDGEFHVQTTKDRPDALEENKKIARNTWATTRLDRGLLFTGYPGCITVPVRSAKND